MKFFKKKKDIERLHKDINQLFDLFEDALSKERKLDDKLRLVETELDRYKEYFTTLVVYLKISFEQKTIPDDRYPKPTQIMTTITVVRKLKK